MAYIKMKTNNFSNIFKYQHLNLKHSQSLQESNYHHLSDENNRMESRKESKALMLDCKISLPCHAKLVYGPLLPSNSGNNTVCYPG